MKRSILRTLFALVLCLGLLPVAAQAEELESISVGESKTVSLEHLEEKQFSFTPDETGEYIFYMGIGTGAVDPETGTDYYFDICSLYVENSSGTELGEEFSHYSNRGIYCQVQAGETYTVRAVNDQDFAYPITGTFHLIKSEPAQSIEIKSTYEYQWYVGETMWQLYVETDPAVSSERTFTWESSDESVIDLLALDSYYCYAECVGAGTATITAKTESGVSASVTVEVKEVSNKCGDNAIWNFDEATSTLTISGEGAMYDIDGTAPWISLSNSINHVVIEEGITRIGNKSFLNDMLQSVEIADSVTSIGVSAFPSYAPASIEVSEYVTEIGQNAFLGVVKVKVSENNPNYSSDDYGSLYNKNKTELLHVSSALTGEFSIPETVVTIGKQAFYLCADITGVTIPSSVTTIGENAFWGCQSITELTIPSSVSVIGQQAFRACTGLQEIKIPESVEKIGTGAFAACRNLSGIWVNENNPNYSNDEFGVLFNKDASKLIMAPGGLAGCYEIPTSARAIASDAFMFCQQLTGIVLNTKITEIPDEAFRYCTGLTEITIPETVSNIDVWAFMSCTNLTQITFEGDAPTFGYGAFESVTATAYYPAGNSTWTSDIMQNYGGNITWVAYSTEKIDAPTIKVTNNASTGKPVISWSAVDGASKYELYWAASKSGTYTKIGTTTGTSLTNKSAVAGKQYYYKVKAVSSSGAKSDFSNIVTRSCDLPRPVVSVSNVASTGKVKLSWPAIEGAAKYEVYRATSKSGTYTKIYTTTGTSCTNTSAVAGTQYYYKVRALHGTNTGAHSADSVIVTRSCDLPQPVVSVTNVASSGKVKLTWEKIEGAAKYEVYRATSKSGEYTKIYTTTGTSCTNTSGVAGTLYYYKVRALHGTSTGAHSAYSAIVNRRCDLPQPKVTVTNVASTGKVKLTWEKIEGAAKYEVYRATSKTGTYTKIYTTTGTSCTNTSATAGTTYYYKVIALHSNSAANSAYSAIVERTCDLAQPTLTVTLDSNGKPKLTWSKVEGATKYQVYRATSKSGTYSLIYTTTSGTSVTNKSNLVSGTTYYYKVIAVHSKTAANSAYSAIKSVTVK